MRASVFGHAAARGQHLHAACDWVARMLVLWGPGLPALHGSACKVVTGLLHVSHVRLVLHGAHIKETNAQSAHVQLEAGGVAVQGSLRCQVQHVPACAGPGRQLKLPVPQAQLQRRCWSPTAHLDPCASKVRLVGSYTAGFWHGSGVEGAGVHMKRSWTLLALNHHQLAAATGT